MGKVFKWRLHRESDQIFEIRNTDPLHHIAIQCLIFYVNFVHLSMNCGFRCPERTLKKLENSANIWNVFPLSYVLTLPSRYWFCTQRHPYLRLDRYISVPRGANWTVVFSRQIYSRKYVRKAIIHILNCISMVWNHSRYILRLSYKQRKRNRDRVLHSLPSKKWFFNTMLILGIFLPIYLPKRTKPVFQFHGFILVHMWNCLKAFFVSSLWPEYYGGFYFGNFSNLKLQERLTFFRFLQQYHT